MKRLYILLIVGVAMHLLTGCRDRIEINDIAIVTSTALDKVEDNKIHMTLMISVPKSIEKTGTGGGGSSEKEPSMLISENGKSVMDAYQKIQKKISRRIIFSHNKNIIIGENLAREGVSSVLDFFTRHREVRLESFILFTKGEASDILKSKPQLEALTSEEIREEQELNTCVKTRLRDFIYMLTETGVEPIAAQIENVPLEVSSQNNSESQELQSGPTCSGIIGSAVFHKDKLVGWMNNEETLGVLWLRNKIDTAVITATVPNENGGGKLSAQVINSRTKVKPILKDNKIIIQVDIYVKENIYDDKSELDLSDYKMMPPIKKMFEAKVKEHVQIALNKVQKQLKTDVLGFGHAVYIKYSKQWNDMYKESWDHVFPNVEVVVDPNVKVAHVGRSDKSFLKSVE